MAAEALLERSFIIVGGDFTNAGEVSSKVKKLLQEAGVHPKIIRRVTISTYEAEMNVVCYARKGTLTLSVTPEVLRIRVADEGKGIDDGYRIRQGSKDEGTFPEIGKIYGKSDRPCL